MNNSFNFLTLILHSLFFSKYKKIINSWTYINVPLNLILNTLYYTTTNILNVKQCTLVCHYRPPIETEDARTSKNPNNAVKENMALSGINTVRTLRIYFRRDESTTGRQFILHTTH